MLDDSNNDVIFKSGILMDINKERDHYLFWRYSK